jgi:hypothetical protein
MSYLRYLPHFNNFFAQQETSSLLPVEMVEHLRKGIGSKGQVSSLLILYAFIFG